MVRQFQASEKINNAALEILAIIETGDKEKALGKIGAFQDSEPDARFTLARLLISTGQVRQNRAIIECGTEVFERLKAKSAVPADPTLYYDVTNGYIRAAARSVIQ
jgi:thioredoxin-like negative regulator of GroEL